MKGSSLLIILLFILTIGLGGVAIWIGWRLSQEEEVTPEESEAYQRGGGEVVNACGAVCDGNISDGFMGQDRPGCGCCCIQNQSGWVGRRNECGNDGCVGFDCKGNDCYVMARTCTANEVTYRTDGQGNQCMVCENGQVDTSLGDSLFDSISYSYYFTTSVHNSRGGNIPNDCLVIQIDVVCQGTSGAADFIVWRGNRWQELDSTYCGGQPPTTSTTTSTTTSSTTTTTTTTQPTEEPVCGETCTTTCGDGTVCHSGVCCTDCGDGIWACDGDCDCAVGGGMTCESLIASPDPDTLTEDDLRAGSVDIDLTTTAAVNNVTIGPRGYDYGTDIPGATFTTDPGSSTTTLTIPQGTTSGTYSIWVMVTGSGEEQTYQSGCTSATSCEGDGEGCLLSFSIGSGTCDCESVTRSPSDNNIAAGSYISYTMTAEDQNGAPCEVDASEVNWSTTGSPTLVEEERSPTSGGAVQHHIVYQVPAGASSGTEYCVSAEIDANGVQDACENCFTIASVPELPGFMAEKTSTIECINNNTAARITYNISVRNISGVSGVIEYVQDTYDARFQSSWVGNITPTPDSHSGNVIRWDNNGSGYTLAAGGELNFSYEVTVPSEYFGTYEDGEFVPYEYVNHAVVKPENQNPINLETIVEITCLGGIPPTGVMDSAIRVIIISYLLVLFGVLGMRYYGVRELGAWLGKLSERSKLRRRDGFEKKVLEDVDDE